MPNMKFEKYWGFDTVEPGCSGCRKSAARLFRKVLYRAELYLTL